MASGCCHHLISQEFSKPALPGIVADAGSVFHSPKTKTLSPIIRAHDLLCPGIVRGEVACASAFLNIMPLFIVAVTHAMIVLEVSELSRIKRATGYMMVTRAGSRRSRRAKL